MRKCTYECSYFQHLQLHSKDADITSRYLHLHPHHFGPILDNEHFRPVLVFKTFFVSILKSILNDFKNNLGRFLVF
jgi:hypothetical protein